MKPFRSGAFFFMKFVIQNLKFGLGSKQSYNLYLKCSTTCSRRTSGIFSCGITGESPSHGEDETRKVIQTVSSKIAEGIWMLEKSLQKGCYVNIQKKSEVAIITYRLLQNDTLR